MHVLIDLYVIHTFQVNKSDPKPTMQIDLDLIYMVFFLCI